MNLKKLSICGILIGIFNPTYSKIPNSNFYNSKVNWYYHIFYAKTHKNTTKESINCEKESFLSPKDSIFLKTKASHWKILPSPMKESFRSLFVVSEKEVWFSGTHGTLVHTIDKGRTFQTIHVPEAENLDFRGIYVLKSHAVIVISSGESENGKAKVFKSKDEGFHWTLVYSTSDSGIFLDGIKFWDSQKGIILGDPLKNQFFLLKTVDGGDTWHKVANLHIPDSRPEEGAFAASNSSLFLKKQGEVWFGTGGIQGGRIFYSNDFGQNWSAIQTSVKTNRSAGIFGIYFLGKIHGFVFGGDHTQVSDTVHNWNKSLDGGKTWSPVYCPIPSGYIESMTSDKQKTLIALGPAGTSISGNLGISWKKIDSNSFHAVSKYKKSIWACGPNGLLGNWVP